MASMDNPGIQRLAALLIIAVIVVYIMIVAKIILLPLAWALLVSLLILPVVQWLETKKVPRSLAIIAILLLVTGIASAVLYLLAIQVAGILNDVPVITEKINQWVQSFQDYAEVKLGVSHEVMSQHLGNSMTEMISTAVRQLRNSLFSVFQTLTVISIIPLYIFFMLYYRDIFYEGFLKIVKNYEARAGSLVNKINRVIQRYLSGMIIVTIILGGMIYVSLILLGINYALFFSVMLAVFNLIPYVGIIIGSLAVILYTIATVEAAYYPFLVLAVLWIIQLIENNLLTPYIVGTQVKVNPLIALVAIFAGASIWGVSGMILFLPLVGIMKVVFDEFETLKPFGILFGNYREPKSEPPESGSTV